MPRQRGASPFGNRQLLSPLQIPRLLRQDRANGEAKAQRWSITVKPFSRSGSFSCAARPHCGRATLAHSNDVARRGCDPSPPWRATADEIRALKAELKRLEAKVAAQARKQKEQVQIHEVAARPAAPAAAPATTFSSAYGPVALAPLGGAPQTGLTGVESAIRGLPVAGAPSLYINGVSITPGGFLALEGVFRNRNLPADIGSSY